MLLEEDTSIELSDADATNLIRLLSASIKKAVGEKIVPATDNRKQYYTKAQRVREPSIDPYALLGILTVHLASLSKNTVWHRLGSANVM